MTTGVSKWQKFRRTGHVSWQANPMDALRRKMTTGLDLEAGQDEVRRGDELQVRVTVSRPEQLGDVELGLVCTELYDVETASGGDDGGTSRSTSTAVAHELWQPVPCVEGTHGVRLQIPSSAPFSYEGLCLSYKWEVVARGRRAGKLDARATRRIQVIA